jgi:hypothetical protein
MQMTVGITVTVLQNCTMSHHKRQAIAFTFTLKMEAECTSRTSAILPKRTWRKVAGTDQHQ